jgi:heme a synthase
MVTIHMLIALVIVGLLIYTITRSQDFTIVQLNDKTPFKWLMLGVLVISLIQTISGTQVRENVDAVALVMGEQNRAYWIENLSGIFKFHRTFSLVSVGLTVYVLIAIRKSFERESLIYKAALALLLLISVQIFSGKLLDSFGFPKQIQSVHLFVGSLIAGVQLFITILVFSKTSIAAKA